MARVINMSQVVELPEVANPKTGNGSGWIVTVYNNEHNTWDEVMTILMLATECDAEEAYVETWEVDNLGKSVVHHGGEEVCREAASIISRIGIRVEVTEE